MGNSVSSISGGGGNNPGEKKYPLTVNTSGIEDGHYVVFYSGLSVDQVVNICESIEGIPTVTDFTIIIPGVYSKNTNINNQYTLTSVKLEPSQPSQSQPSESQPTQPTPVQSSVEGEEAEKNETKEKSETKYGIIADNNYYLLVTKSSLYISATKDSIVVLRGADSESFECRIRIGSSNSTYKTTYFDAYITDDFSNMLSSSNPINPIVKKRVFNELSIVPTIYLNLVSYQLMKRYNARYMYAVTCRIDKLETGMAHINTVRSNANIMAIYYYNAEDKFIADAVNFVIDKDSYSLTNNGVTVFPVGHEAPDKDNRTVRFKGRTLSMDTSKTNNKAQLQLVKTKDVLDIVPPNISVGYQQGTRLFVSLPDNVTQIFSPNQTLQLSRTDFQLYVGLMDVDFEVDIIGTLCNVPKMPENKFIIYFSGDKEIFNSYVLPDGLYKIKNGDKSIGITNINPLKDGVNLSNYYLTLGLGKDEPITKYDVVVDKNFVKTLRNNQVKSNQSMIATHGVDMRNFGYYIPNSELLLPANYTNDDKLVVVIGMDETPSAIWNMAKILRYKYERKNWVLNFGLLENNILGECEGFKVLTADKNMYILYPDNFNGTISQPDNKSFDVTIEGRKTMLVSQHHIVKSIREDYVAYFSAYPGEISKSVQDYQQFKYLQAQKISYVDYGIAELKISTKDNFIGGMSNTFTLYADKVKFDKPEIKTDYLGKTHMCLDYFPHIPSSDVMMAYLAAYKLFIKQGTNDQIIKYTCLMRVRKEWLVGKTPEDYYEVITGANKDFSLLFLFGGKNSRYNYDASKKEFTSSGFQTIVFDSVKAKSETPPTNGEIYMENPLDEMIKPSDDVNYINGPLNYSWSMLTSTVFAYNQNDFIALRLTPYNETMSAVFTPNGSVIQSDVSLSRQTFFNTDWTYFVYTLATLVNKEKTPPTSNCCLFFEIKTFQDTNMKMPSLKQSIKDYIKKANTAFVKFDVIHDNINRLYIMSNIDIVLSMDASYYTYDYSRMYIRSEKFPTASLGSDSTDLLLDMIDSKFVFNASSNMYTNVVYSLRVSQESSPIVYPQVDKSSRRSEGVTVQTDNSFWNSIRAFVYIDDLERFEIDNLVSMTDYLQSDLNGFFILTKVNYDITSSETWMLGRCVVVRGNSKTPITIEERLNKTYYYIKVNDAKYAGDYMKFAIWNTDRKPESKDIENIDFIINNKSVGVEYGGDISVQQNERIGIATNYMTFNFPNDTLKSYPKFINFTNSLNKYILFARPVVKEAIKERENDTIAIMHIELISGDYDFSEIINYIVQYRTLTKNTIKYFIIFTPVKTIKKPDKQYKMVVGDLTFDTSEFVFTSDPRVLIYPKIDLDPTTSAYKLLPDVLFFNTGFKGPSSPGENVYIHGPDNDNMVVDLGTSNYKKGPGTNQTFLNMRMNIVSLISK